MKKYGIYILDLYKKHDARTMDSLGNEIVLGKYEDLTIEKINSFEEAERLLSIRDFDMPNHQGNNYPVSSLVLYSLEDEQKEIQNGMNFWSLECFPEYPFQSVTLVSFESDVLKDLENKIDDLHNKLIRSEYTDLECFCFGTFGAYTLCIITRSKRVSTLVNFVNSLSKMILGEDNKDQVFSSYTLLSYLDCQTAYLTPEKKLGEKDEFEYIANIQITYTNRFAAEEFLSYLETKIDEDAIVYSTLGEYDICIHVPIDKLPISVYLKDGILNSYSPFYKSHVLQSSTRISKREKISNFHKTINFDLGLKEKYSEASTYLKQKFEQINDSLQQLFSSADSNGRLFPTNLKRMFNIVNLDFRCAFSLAPNSYFADDLLRLFKASIDYAKTLFINSNETNAENVCSTICDTAKLVTDAAYNMIQANDYTITEPYSFLYNSSICQSIMQSYLGFIKMLLISFYENCNKDQSEIIPVVVFDPKLNVMKSDIYMSLDNGLNTVPKNSPRIVSFRLPYDAIYNIILYIPLLVHELMHYFCPKDRNTRNKLLFKIFLKVYFVNMTLCLYYSEESGNVDSASLTSFANDWVDENYNSLLLKMESGRVIDFSDISMTFSKKLEGLFNQAFSKYGNNDEISYIFNFYFEFLKKMSVDISSEDSIKCVSDIVFKTVVEKLKSFNESTLKQKIVLTGKNRSAIKVLNSISQGIKEIVCDIMMVHYCELRMESYLAILIISMYSNDINKLDSTQQIVRLGYMVHHYGFPLKKPFRFKENMREAILSIIKHINPLCGERCQKFDNYFTMIENAIEDFRLYHMFYLDDIDKIVDCYAISDYSHKDGDHDDEIQECLNNLYCIITRIKNTYNFYQEKEHHNMQVVFSPKTEVKITQMLKKQFGLYTINKFYTNKQNTKEYFVSSIKIGKEETASIYSTTNPFPLTLTLNDLGIERSLGQIRSLLTDNDDEQLWYRGQMDASWPVSPSLFRKGGDYRSNLIDAYEQFRAQACESLEIHNNIDSDSDWIAFMQHYFVPTHFLDWSEQPLTSLYFALENYFDNPCKFENTNIPPCGKGDYNCASLYVLNPIRMNYAFKGINGVPNISILRNEEKYRNYILTSRDEKGKVCITNTKEFLIQPSSPPTENYLPLAVITSQLSSRIKAQQGHFVIYNLTVNYNNKNPKEIGDIICLYNIQKEMYLQSIHEQKIFKPFLIKLVIPKHMKNQVAMTVKNYGIRKSSFYPELMNIGADISRFLFKQSETPAVV